MGVRGGAGGQQRADINALWYKVEVWVEVMARLVGVVLYCLRREALQSVVQPLGALFAQALGGGAVVQRLRRAVAQPKEVFQFNPAPGGEAVSDAAVSSVRRAAAVFFVDMKTRV